MKQLESLQVAKSNSVGRATLNYNFLDNRDFREVVLPFTGSVAFLASFPEENRTCFLIPIFQDDVYEYRETFNITLSLGIGVTGVTIDPPVTEVFILDDEREQHNA